MDDITGTLQPLALHKVLTDVSACQCFNMYCGPASHWNVAILFINLNHFAFSMKFGTIFIYFHLQIFISTLYVPLNILCPHLCSELVVIRPYKVNFFFSFPIVWLFNNDLYFMTFKVFSWWFFFCFFFFTCFSTGVRSSLDVFLDFCLWSLGFWDI